MANNNKQLKVNLQFTADNKKLLQSIKDVQGALSELTSSMSANSYGKTLNRDLQEATLQATKLQAILDSSMNAETGNLDLGKFTQQIKASGKDLAYYRDQLYQLGPAGEQTFVKLSNAITMAEMPLMRTNKLISELWSTMKNTVRWQLSSSALHGFIGALQTAYGYSQDLNESLNNIRIVTGNSVENMSLFAKEANKAAKQLSATTLDYTDAALIYYQQGLSESEVKARTEVTIKLANVSRQSAEEVSDQMTAIWNNFYDGSKSLEHYANVLTALGAATASSTEEIAGGLEKFAAVADTIGLSYEYAAAALATITSNTRESEEVVGTALKTIFARIQGLNLGETLEDGTTLNKYSEALSRVGISILDTQGNLKTMDTLLDEMGEKWDDLSKAQQTALAQTVAGTRQYNQLIALMANWNSGDGDSFQANLKNAMSADNTLQDQANIYAESWEAANKRVQASAETIYNAILDDEFFIELTDKFAELLDGVKLFIDSLGGVKGILFTIGSLATSIFSKQIGESLTNAAYNIRMMLPGGKDVERKTKENVNNLLVQGVKDTDTPGSGYRSAAYEAIAKNQINYINNAKTMSEVETKVNQLMMDRNRLMADDVVQQGEKIDKLKRIEQLERKRVQRKADEAGRDLNLADKDRKKITKEISKEQVKYEKFANAQIMADEIINKTVQIDIETGESVDTIRAQIARIVSELAELDDIAEENVAGETLEKNYQKLRGTFGITEKQAKKLWDSLRNEKDLDKIITEFNKISQSAGEKAATSLNKLRNELIKCTGDTDKADQLLEDYLKTVEEFGIESVDAADKLAQLNHMVEQHNKKMDEGATKPIPFAESLSKATGAVMALGQAYSTITGIVDVFNDENSTVIDKVMAIGMGIGTLIPTIIAIAPAFSSASVAATLFGEKAAEAGVLANLAMWQVTAIVAGITAIVAVIAILATQESEAERKAKEAAKAAEEMKTAADDAAQSLNNIKSAFEAYDTAVDKLNECVKGTEEWNDALAEVNKTVLQILQDVPELAANANLFTRDLETGMLMINEDERANVLNMAEHSANTAAATSIIANAQSKSASANRSHEVLSKKLTDRMVNSFWHEQYLDVGKILADNAKDLADLPEAEYRQKVTKLLEDATKDSIKTASNFDKQINTIVNSTIKYQTQVNSLAANTEAAAQQMRTAFELLADQQLGSKYGGAEKSIASAELQRRTTELTNAFEELMTSNATDKSAKEAADILRYGGKLGINQASGADNEIYKYIAGLMEQYNTGYSFATGNTVLGSDNNRRFIFTDNEGDRTEGKSALWVAQTLAAAKALEELASNAEAAGTMLQDMDTKIATNSKGDQHTQDVSSTILRGFIANKNFDGYSMSDFNTFYEEVAKHSGDTGGDISKEDAAWYVDKMFGDGQDGSISEETAQKYGFDSAQAMIDTFYDQLSTLGESWQAIELPSDLIGTSNLEIETVNKLSNIFKNIDLGPAGAAASQTFKDGLNEMLKGLDEETQTKALGQLASIDWSSWDALEQADAIMKGLGVEINTSTEYWQNFAKEMREATRAFPNFQQLKQTLMDISSITNDLEFGDLIDKEDYQRLIDYNDEWERFFILQSDGSRKFIGNAENMASATQNSIRIQQEDLKNRKKAADAIKNSNLNLSNLSALAIDQEFGDGKDGKLSDTNTHVTEAGYTGEGAGQRYVNDTMINRFNTLLNDKDNGENIKTALLKGGYDQETITAILDEVAKGNHDRFNTMTEYLNDFVNEDYEATDTDLNEMLASTVKSINELEAIKDEIGNAAYEKQKVVLTHALEEAKPTEQYHEEEQALTSIEHKLQKINALKSTADGKKQLSLLEDENELLGQQVDILQQKYSALTTNVNTQQGTLANKYGATFDQNGNITNYESIMENNIGNWDAVSAELDAYENSLSDLKDTEMDLIDIQNNLQENALASLTVFGTEIDKYSAKMQHYNSILEQYKNLSTLIGKDTDYKSLNSILSGQAKIAQNTLEISKQSVEFYSTKAGELKQKMNDAMGNEKAFAMYKQQWEEAEAKAREAEENMLADLQTWAESEKAVLENTLADLGNTLEDTLTGGLSFDKLATQMERAQSLQEDYLTTTNQIYETTKMMRTAQQAIDASSNSIAKEKLKGFINETKSMQEQGKLSQYELDMQKAKYDLLVAEIALEEAQNAKSTVRLQRDAEGNFGYVYTADSNAVNDAQQQYDDAENALYNKGLEGANDYSQKSQQTMQEMVEALKTIQTNYQNGMYTSEQEYEAAMLETKEHYLQKLQDYGMLYNIAIGADSRVMAEAWSSSFADMTLDTENWDNAIEDYISGAKNAFNDWSDVVATIKETTGGDLTNLTNKVSEITTASNELVTTLLGAEGGDGGVLGKLKTGFDEVAKAINDAITSLNTEITVTSNTENESTGGDSGNNLLRPGGTKFAITATHVGAASTGGLTSNWGPEGKMLMVHESELILNKDQTNKFFDNLAIMESILSTIDSYALGQQFGGMLQSPAYSSTSSGTLEQSVHIEASFPGVTDRNEIEEAFNNLVNKASQYANRK